MHWGRLIVGVVGDVLIVLGLVALVVGMVRIGFPDAGACELEGQCESSLFGVGLAMIAAGVIVEVALGVWWLLRRRHARENGKARPV